MDDFAQILRFLTGGIQADAEQVFDKHLPMKLDDMDGDTFSTAATLRGWGVRAGAGNARALLINDWCGRVLVARQGLQR